MRSNVAATIRRNGDADLKYLIVEDDPNLRLLWRSVLSDLGCSIHEAATLEAAEDALACDTFDVMILDLYLGRSNGMTLAVSVQQNYPKCKVIVVTGAAGVKTKDLQAQATSIVSVHRKPVDIEDLIAVCEALHEPGTHATGT
jgi:DNA-binding NtrC family response regulator